MSKWGQYYADFKQNAEEDSYLDAQSFEEDARRYADRRMSENKKPLHEFRAFKQPFADLDELERAITRVKLEASHYPEYEFKHADILTPWAECQLQVVYKLKDEHK